MQNSLRKGSTCERENSKLRGKSLTSVELSCQNACAAGNAVTWQAFHGVPPALLAAGLTEEFLADDQHSVAFINACKYTRTPACSLDAWHDLMEESWRSADVDQCCSQEMFIRTQSPFANHC